MSAQYEGGCQCGNVRYQVTDEPRQVVACHCTDCQRQSGSAFGMTMVVDEAAFRITRGEPAIYRSVSSSGRAKIGAFCADCGTRVYHQPEWRKGTISVKPGTLDDTKWLQPQLHLWTRSKQPWVIIPEGVESHERQPT